MNTRFRPSRKTTVPLVLVVLVLVAGACSRGANDEPAALRAPAQGASVDDFDVFAGEDGDVGAPVPETPSEPAAPPAPEPDTLGSGGVTLASLQTVDLGRDIIYRADLTVAVTDVPTAGAEATLIIESLGGFMFGQQTTGGARPRSVLTFKILPENFQAALDELGSIGELRQQNVSADDVTERVVDLESRITTAEASVTRLREFISSATDINAIAELERELLNRETTLETLRGQLRTLQDQVALATIILTLTEDDVDPDMHVAVSTYLGHDDAGESCPGETEPQFIEGDDVTVCFEIFNTGDTSLTGFTLRDSVLEVELSDLIVVFGSTELLEPGQSVVLAAEITVERDLRTQTKVTAEAVKESTGEIIVGRTVTRTETSYLSVEDEGGLPGFRDGVSASWDFLQDVGGLAVLAGGAVLPFIWLVVIAGIWLWLRYRRTRRQASTTEDFVESRSEPLQ